MRHAKAFTLVILHVEHELLLIMIDQEGYLTLRCGGNISMETSTRYDIYCLWYDQTK